MQFTIETEQEADGRWIAEVMEIPGVMKYGQDREHAIRQAEALALRVMAERSAISRVKTSGSTRGASVQQPLSFP